jgi:hypothetical protein
MATRDEVDEFLRDFKVKLGVFDILFRDDRGKNVQALADLEIRPAERKSIIESLVADDYCEGPLEDTLYHSPGLWVFGKTINGQTVYIKVSFGFPNLSVICISFHIAEHILYYPLRGAQS